ncbi:uncharacterized protein FTJAE_13314 [Fusarium tjaetaba]|uniref:Uncharacterized protein n=1 Tax=Fusarium tjaetaba TaxID=1567544 RepID=A0A8H5QHX2_9HYPO|nr:uncharacterized protein FTJAE_13314 [Fusarium tjaetaba]KAF5615612.1 hypothetical protein FTJAE_13314 [Fusarium tjaetaba]
MLAKSTRAHSPLQVALFENNRLYCGNLQKAAKSGALGLVKGHTNIPRKASRDAVKSIGESAVRRCVGTMTSAAGYRITLWYLLRHITYGEPPFLVRHD